MRHAWILLPALLLSPGCRGMLPRTGRALDHLIPDGAEKKRLYALFTGNGQRYFDAGKFAQAEDQFLKALQVDTYGHKANLCAGWSALQQGTIAKLEAARDRFHRTLDLDSSDSRAWLGLGVAHADLGFRRLREAERLEERAPAPGREGGAIGGGARGLRRQAEEDFRDAEEALERTLRLHRDDPRAVLTLGNIATSRGEFAAAEGRYRRYVELAVRTREIFQKRLPDLEQEEDRRALRAKIQRNVRDEGNVRVMLANQYYKQERHREALAELDAILDVNPSPPDNVYLLRAQCLAAMGSTQEAIADVDRFLKYTSRKFDPLVEQAYRFKEEYSARLASAPGVPGR